MKAEKRKQQRQRQRVDSIEMLRRQADAAMLPGASVTVKRGPGWRLLNKKVKA